MSNNLALAQQNAYQLSRSLMTPVILFQTEDHEYGVMTADEFDGDEDSIVHEYNPWDFRKGRAAQ